MSSSASEYRPYNTAPVKQTAEDPFGNVKIPSKSIKPMPLLMGFELEFMSVYRHDVGSTEFYPTPHPMTLDRYIESRMAGWGLKVVSDHKKVPPSPDSSESPASSEEEQDLSPEQDLPLEPTDPNAETPDYATWRLTTDESLGFEDEEEATDQIFLDPTARHMKDYTVVGRELVSNPLPALEASTTDPSLGEDFAVIARYVASLFRLNSKEETVVIEPLVSDSDSDNDKDSDDDEEMESEKENDSEKEDDSENENDSEQGDDDNNKDDSDDGDSSETRHDNPKCSDSGEEASEEKEVKPMLLYSSYVNNKCGLHIHFGLPENNPIPLRILKELAIILVVFEEVIDRLHHHSRVPWGEWRHLAYGNHFCDSNCKAFFAGHHRCCGYKDMDTIRSMIMETPNYFSLCHLMSSRGPLKPSDPTGASDRSPSSSSGLESSDGSEANASDDEKPSPAQDKTITPVQDNTTPTDNAPEFITIYGSDYGRGSPGGPSRYKFWGSEKGLVPSLAMRLSRTPHGDPDRTNDLHGELAAAIGRHPTFRIDI
jgi:hypothetical protein